MIPFFIIKRKKKKKTIFPIMAYTHDSLILPLSFFSSTLYCVEVIKFGLRSIDIDIDTNMQLCITVLKSLDHHKVWISQLIKTSFRYVFIYLLHIL